MRAGDFWQGGGRRALWGPAAGPAALFVLVGVSVITGLILVLTGGTFSYVLDDAYIHLAVAENLIRFGDYGVNPGVPAAACSSLLWPFLLVPLQAVGLGPWAPLLLNTLAALGLVLALARLATLILPPADGRRPVDAAWLALLLLLPANVFGLIFTGLEHTLQVALVAWTVVLLVAWETAPVGAPPPRALFIALVLGPLVRYENLAISLPLLGLIWLSGAGRARAVVAGVVLVAILGAMAAFWVTQGLEPVPSSIRAKSLPLVEQEIPGWAGRSLAKNLNYRQLALATLVLPLAAFVVLSPRRPRRERLVALAVATALGGHLLLGERGGFFRYEVYVVVYVLLFALWWQRRPLAEAWSASPWAARLAAGVAAVVLAVPALSGWVRLPRSGHNIFEQQHQMHRFVAEFWQDRVAVNDLGWVAYRNDHPVLDLWGLGSPDALTARQAARQGKLPEQWEGAWMDALMSAHDTEVAIVYERWFPELPDTWIAIGELHLSGVKHTPHQSSVVFYATTEAAAARLRAALPPWVATLPPGVRFDMDELSN